MPYFEPKSTQPLLKGLRAMAGLYFEKVLVPQVLSTGYYLACSQHLTHTC